ncbi:Uncharacterised protein [Klebsiella pneumoniae]|nr:Uncharacterised protein [Klebsiella pneumoniae]
MILRQHVPYTPFRQDERFSENSIVDECRGQRSPSLIPVGMTAICKCLVT